jgi:single-strand DNA-binding protein
MPGSNNEVRLIGRVAAAPLERELPSGDAVVTVRLIIDREGPAPGRSAQRVDTIDCVAWTARVQRTVRRWQPGDQVEVSGALRRRFYRATDGPRSRFEVEIAVARRPR